MNTKNLHFSYDEDGKLIIEFETEEGRHYRLDDAYVIGINVGVAPETPVDFIPLHFDVSGDDKEPA